MEKYTLTQIKKVLDKIEKETSNINVKLYIAGGIVPYLLLNQDSNRLHSDIDLICDIKDMNTLRILAQKYSVYQKQLDSLNFKNKDYGFEIFINNIKVGIYPFIIKNKIIYQMLKCDDILTKIAENRFQEFYKLGYYNAKRE